MVVLRTAIARTLVPLLWMVTRTKSILVDFPICQWCLCLGETDNFLMSTMKHIVCGFHIISQVNRQRNSLYAMKVTMKSSVSKHGNQHRVKYSNLGLIVCRLCMYICLSKAIKCDNITFPCRNLASPRRNSVNLHLSPGAPTDTPHTVLWAEMRILNGIQALFSRTIPVSY